MDARIRSWVSLDVPLAQATSQHVTGVPGELWFSRLPSSTALALCYRAEKPPDSLLIDNYIPPNRTGPFPAPFSPAAAPACSSSGSPELGGQVGSQQGTGAQEEDAPLCSLCPTATSQLPGVSTGGSKQAFCCPKRGCLVLVTPQRIPPSFLLNPLTGTGGRSHIFKASLPNMLPRFISANPTHGTQITAFSSIRKSKSPND